MKNANYVRGALAQFKRYLCNGIDVFFAGNTGLARRALSWQTPR
ncbi:glycerophosphodiester phosphodiesterase [Xanthomonas campestris]|nr:glycerophosphodiester phosphodiesterase [Xanthomonas campestris]MCC5074241.1 glycerophosphodiester phosphodiesterase [Xanthomonas campestris pv. plantaginis]MEA9606402.1 glycerophosphodiester phosphodiesterase [Xanthomonas campestris pv. plantaginis]